MEFICIIREDDEFYRINLIIFDRMYCVLFVIKVDLIVGGDYDLLRRV